MDILEGLTESQRLAVTHGEGPLLVVAGAGSGKTRVITRRVAHLAATGVPPYRILAITFTNKAADEMKKRVADLSGAHGAWISTFHSMCARMLRQFSDLLGFSHPFTIYDRADSLACVKSVLTELGLTGGGVSPQSFLSAISRAKNQMLTPDECAAQARGPREAAVARVYRLYEQTCRANNALDFDDLLLRTAQLLSADESFRTYWQTRFSHVLIDEYQDTNRPQYMIARLLCSRHRNICATGDPDQSIYAWRGADIRNILDFRKDYPDVRTVKLEENFRSTKMILLAASGVIEHNRSRIERGLWTRNPGGSAVRVVESASDTDEANAILAGILANVKEGSAYADMAVFYRTHAQSRAIEEALRDAGVPYAILDAVEFYNRKEIKDVVAYLKAIVNPADGVSLLRIINEPRRGIGKRTLDRVLAFAASKGLSVAEAIAAPEDISSLPPRATAALKQFAALLDRLRGLPRSPAAELVRRVLAETGYMKRLKESGTEEDASRVENLEELVNAAAEFDVEYPDGDIAAFLEKVTLVSDSDTMTGEQGKVMLMTLHSAKGLEFPVVFIAGVQEGLLPHANALGSASRVEEERRLCYVGMTRAKQKLCLHWASEHRIYGQMGMAMPSRFILEIPSEAREDVFGGAGVVYGDELVEAVPKAEGRDRGVERVIEYDADVVTYGGVGVSAGDRVRHPMLGTGRVVSVSGTGDRSRVEVDFGGRRRKLMLKYAKLVRIG